MVEGKWTEVIGIITADRNFFMPVMLEPSIMFLSIDWGEMILPNFCEEVVVLDKLNMDLCYVI